MRGGLVTSVLLHAAILGWALFTIQAQRELRVAEPEPIAVDLVNASDLTRLRQGARNAKQLEAEAKEAPKPEPVKKEAPKPTPAAAAPPPPPPPPPKEEPKKEEPPPKEVAAVPPPPAAPPPVPAPEEQKKLDELLKEQERQAEEQRKADEQRQAEEAKKQAELKKKLDEAKKKKEAELKKKREEDRKRREAEAKKKQFDAENISALLNKIPDKGGPRPSVPLDEQAKAKGPVLGAPEGRDRKLSASEEGMLTSIIRSRLRGCWRLPAGGGGSDTPVVTLKWRLKPDGSLDGDPQVQQERGDPLFRIAAEAAMRAVQQCSPFPLPPDKYGHWKNITWEFDPSQMM
jgi:colicin import membrane protein